MADLQLLRSFLAIYRVGSLSKAAKVLHLSQPALSLQLKALEGMVGRALFVRLARGIEATAAGHDLAQAVAPHVDALESMWESSRVGSSTLVGSVHLGGPADLLAAKVIPSLAGLVAHGLRIITRIDLVEPLIEALADKHLDLVIATKRLSVRGIDFEPLGDEQFLLVGTRRWMGPLVSKRPITALALAGVPLLTYAEDLPVVRRYFRVVFGTRATMQAGLVMADMRALLAAVVAGAGVSVLPRYLCEASVRKGELWAIDDVPSTPTNTLFMAWRTGGLQARVKLVVEQLRTAARTWRL